ncbi:MAG: hypothetical protein ABIL09_08190 [Gemmatimonadota bacterium]
MTPGDLAFYAGILGITMYLCLMVIKHTSQSGKITEAIKRYEDSIASLAQQLEALKAARSQKQPTVDGLVSRVVELRALRDRLQIQLEDLQARVKERDTDIHVKSRGS